MPISAKKNGIWNSGINFFKTSGLWKQINILFLKDEGVWKEADSAVSPVNLRFDVYGGQGRSFLINNAGNPSPSDPGRQGGKGGYTRVDMVIPTAYKITPYSLAGGTGGECAGGPAGGFGIDGEWMVVAGGGGGSAAGYWTQPGGSPYWLQINIAPFTPSRNGSGGYNNSGSSGNVGGNSSSSSFPAGPNDFFYSTGGAGGAGAPGGSGGSPSGSYNAGTPGNGGGGNIRIWKDQGSTSGTLNVNPEWSMTFVTSSNGTSPGARVVITNLDTNGTVNLSGDMPVADLKNI